MSPARKYVTPLEVPDSFECRELFVPRGQTWQALVAGALFTLTQAYNFEQVNGLTPEQTADIFSEVFYAWDREDCPMFPGMVVAAACATPPGSRWLICDGTAVNQADYPSLYAAIGGVFGTGGAGTFRVPDLAGRLPIGVGTGSGLTERELADAGGVESVQLSEGEMPHHDHELHSHLDALAVGPGEFPVSTPSVLTGNTSAKGNDESHENMPPFLALNFFIYTG